MTTKHSFTFGDTTYHTARIDADAYKLPDGTFVGVEWSERKPPIALRVAPIPADVVAQLAPEAIADDVDT